MLGLFPNEGEYRGCELRAKCPSRVFNEYVLHSANITSRLAKILM